MSIQGEIDRIAGNVSETLEIIAGTGVTVGSGSDALPEAASALALTKQDKARVEGQKLILPPPTQAVKQNNAAVSAGTLVL